MGMLKKYHSSSYAIIIGLAIVLLSPVIGCAQSEGNKLASKGSSGNKPGQQNNPVTKNVKLQPQLSSQVNFSRKNAALNAAIKGLQAVLKKKVGEINTVKKELSTTKTELVKARMARVEKDKKISKLNQNIKSLQAAKTDLAKVKKAQIEKDKKINGLSIEIKSVQAVVKKKDTELAALNTAIKGLQAVVKKKDTELVALDTELVEMDTELVLLDKEITMADTRLVAAKAAVNCYRKALSAWDNLHRQEGITEQNLLTIAVELRRTIADCPGI